MLDQRHFRHIAFNVGAMVLPMLLGVLVVPDLIARLGVERFGLLSIAWVLVGYFGLLDLGLGRGLTQFLARQTALEANAAGSAAIARQVRRWMLGIGVFWSLVLLALTPWLTGTALPLPSVVPHEAATAWFCLAVCVPALLWSSSSIGAMEAYSRFSAVNVVRLPMGLASFVAPWAVTHWTIRLDLVLGSLLAVRLGAALALAWLARRHFVRQQTPVAPMHLRTILNFGGWLTVSNVVGPLLSYFDRFAIGMVLSVAAVTYYTVPFDVLSRLPAIPVAMMGVLFPLLAQAQVGQAADGVKSRMVVAATQLLVTFWVPGIFTCTLLGPLLLGWWVGPEIASASAAVWAWIGVGVLLNGFAHIPYTLLHSAGRTDLTAKFHLAELVPYALALWWALHSHGIVGAAAVWTARTAIDTALLYGAAWHFSPACRRACQHALAWGAGSAIVLTITLAMVSSDVAAGAQLLPGFWVPALGLVWSAWRLRILIKLPA